MASAEKVRVISRIKKLMELGQIKNFKIKKPQVFTKPKSGRG
jgi:hypothetical protein